MRHGTVGLLVDIGDAGRDSDSLGWRWVGWDGLRQESPPSGNPRTRLRRFMGLRNLK